MKTKRFFTLAALLVFATTVIWAQTTIATMTTTATTVKVRTNYTGTGTITANGTLLPSSGAETSVTVNAGKVTLTITGSVILTELTCSDNALTNLDVSSTTLRNLYCHNNALTTLDLSGCPLLAALYCTNNAIAELDLSVCTALETLRCDGNCLTVLNLIGCVALEYMEARNQAITVTATGGVYKNPIAYGNPTGVEAIKINGLTYATGAALPAPESNNTLTFTTVVIGGYAFGGVITLKGYTAVSNLTAAGIKVCTTSDGIIITGAPLGVPIHIYNISGQLLSDIPNTADETHITLAQAGVYIVKIGTETVKVLW